MLKRAVKQGFWAEYVLVDSWFSSHEFIQTVRELGKKPMHLICGIRKDGRIMALDYLKIRETGV